MAKPCSWCVSVHRQHVEEAIGAGESVASVARRFGLPRDQWRHHKTHANTVDGVTSLATIRAEIVDGGGGPHTVIPRLEGLLIQIGACKQRWQDRPATIVQLLRLERDVLGDIAKLRGEFPDKPTISVGELTEWRLVLDTLQSHPRALRAVSQALDSAS